MKQKMMQKLVKSKLPNDMPPEQREKVTAAVAENPELFQQIGKEIKTKMKEENKDEMTAAVEVMKKHQDKLQGLMK